MTPATHARLTELFGEALECSPEARGRLLARVRAEDGALADELVALLAADRLEVPALDTGALVPRSQRVGTEDSTLRVGMGEDPTRPDTAPLVGIPDAPAISGYTLTGVLGKGGMGTVYAARQHAPSRDVAIKVLHATTHESLVRFHAEVEIMGRLDHPGIAKIFSAGQAGSHPYFVMERVEGVTLEARLATLSRRERLTLFAAICDAVHHAHVKGIFHRDLKPSNVMIRDDGRAAILDFGIARVAAGDNETRAGELMGTPVYMSPEQARLRADEVDARSDVYTLGVMLYEVLSGELPYDVRGKPLPAIARAICEEPARPLARHDPTLRGDLEAICDRALQKRPEHRYPSAAALADDVRQQLAGARVSVRVPGTLEQLRRFVRTRPGLAAGLVGAGVAAITVTALWLEARAAWRTADAERARVTRTNVTLEVRTNRLVLDQARAALAHDPRRAIELLRTLTPSGIDAREAWSIADEAIGRGIARELHRAHDGEARWVEPVSTDMDAGFVSGGYDGVAWLRTSGVATPLATSADRARRVHVVRPAPDGQRFAIGLDAGTARIVDRTGKLLVELPPLGGDVERAAWSPDGERVAFAADGGAIAVWSPAGVARHEVESGAESLAWSTDGAHLVAGTDGGGVWILRPGRAPITRAIGAEVLAVWSAGDRVAAIGADGTLRRWRIAAEQLAPIDTVATDLVGKTAVFAPDGTRAVIGSVDGGAALVDGNHVTPLPSHPRQVRAVAASADGTRFATAGDDGSIRVLDLARSRSFALRGHVQRVRQLAFAAGGTQLLSADSEGVVRRWDLDRIAPTVFAPPQPIGRMTVSADARVLAAVTETGELRRWELDTGDERVLGTHPRVTALVIGATLVSADADGTLVWWQTVPARHRAAGPVRGLALSPDHRFVAAATSAGPISLHAGDGTPIATLPGHLEGSDAVAFSPDGRLLVSGGQDRAVRVWQTGAPSAPSIELGPIDGDTRHVVFARSGALVASAGDDGKVRAWSVREGAVDPASHRVLHAHRGAVIGLASDGAARLVSVGRDRTRVEIDLVNGTTTSYVAQSASQPVEGGMWTLRGVPLPIAAGRDLVVAADGRVVTLHPSRPRDFEALRVVLVDLLDDN